MPRAFPQSFDLRLFSGPRAKQFKRPEDAFQQLIGDALKEMAGPYAHISPTLGADGSIDSYLTEGALLAGPLIDLPLPAIIECKAHDDEAKNPRKNIFDQWGKVRKKLEAAAHAGWQELFQPWDTVRGYAYCISANLPNERARTDLDAAIRKFFPALPISQRPPIESIRVVDWNDLRQWLGTLPVVSDEWLGIDLDLVLDHATYLEHLSGFREYLLPSRLEFVAPARDSPFHPARVLEEIEKDDEKNALLLVGAGGVGKTRTAIEVGTLAASSGWRVLHILPDEPGVETEEIAEIVLRHHDSRTLLVFDYIDQMQRLDLGSIRRSLIPAAKERGIQLRLLANSRPGWMGSPNPERDELFSVIELRPTGSHKANLIRTMAARIAPTASEVLGQGEVIRLCGTRAIIALLVARELESRAIADLLKDLNTASLRSGDLVQWLRRRLQENNLSVKHAVASLEPPRPDVPMVAAAAALACAPETRENLVAAAQSAYEHLHRPSANENAQYLVELLVKLGWLESHGIFDSTAHDVVADEVLDQTIHTDAIVFETELSAVLSCSLSIPPGIGRLATALRRVLGSLKNEDAVRSLTAFLEHWLSTNACALGEVLQAGDPDLTGYALGALLSGPPWEESAIQEWDQLFFPWLKAHSTKEEARHLLYKGLKSVHGHQAALIAPALAWLGAHSLAFSATFVITPLLNRLDLPAEEAQQASRFALSWLDQYHDTLESEFVLKPLLRRDDLLIEEAEHARRFALRWLEQHRDSLDVRFVLPSLLRRDDLLIEEAEHARRFALRWLEQHRDSLDAGFVLPPLLERDDLSVEDAEQAKRFALRWVEQHRDSLDAGFVLPPLLERGDLSVEEAEQARRFALPWLEQHQGTSEAGSVISSLLAQDVESEDADWVVKTALRWLQLFPSITQSDYVLLRLFRRTDLSVAIGSSLLSSAIKRLRQRLADDEAFHLLRSCLQYRINNDGLQRQLLSLSVDWLDLHPNNQSADYVWNRVLRYRIVSDSNWQKAAAHACRWLASKKIRDTGVEQTTTSLLMRSQLLETPDREFVINLAVELLRTNLHPEGRRKLRASLEWLLRALYEDDPLKEQIKVALK